jgi:hypothetical protein
MPRQAGSCLSSQTLGIAGMQSRALMNVQRAWNGRHSNACTGQAVNPTRAQTTSSKFLAALALAVRPASLAASAQPQRFDPSTCSRTEPALSSKQRSTRSPMFGKAREALCEVTAHSKQMQALRRSAKPNSRDRAGTSCCAARAGGFGLLASGATQRTMRAGRVPQSALPNPSIERTSPGKPGRRRSPPNEIR